MWKEAHQSLSVGRSAQPWRKGLWKLLLRSIILIPIPTAVPYMCQGDAGLTLLRLNDFVFYSSANVTSPRLGPAMWSKTLLWLKTDLQYVWGSRMHYNTFNVLLLRHQSAVGNWRRQNRSQFQDFREWNTENAICYTRTLSEARPESWSIKLSGNPRTHTYVSVETQNHKTPLRSIRPFCASHGQ